MEGCRQTESTHTSPIHSLTHTHKFECTHMQTFKLEKMQKIQIISWTVPQAQRGLCKAQLHRRTWDEEQPRDAPDWAGPLRIRIAAHKHRAEYQYIRGGLLYHSLLNQLRPLVILPNKAHHCAQCFAVECSGMWRFSLGGRGKGHLFTCFLLLFGESLR